MNRIVDTVSGERVYCQDDVTVTYNRTTAELHNLTGWIVCIKQGHQIVNDVVWCREIADLASVIPDMISYSPLPVQFGDNLIRVIKGSVCHE